MKLNTHETAAAIGDGNHQAREMTTYYRWHAAIYDLTRWTFLFGRNRILNMIQVPEKGTLLEVGCGTGRNLIRIARQSESIKLIGVDVSPHMLEKTTRKTSHISSRVFLFQCPYAPGTFSLSEKVDWVLCSYSLTMFNPGFDEAIRRAWEDLKPGGYFALVDFHDTPRRWFRWWMGKNHVRMDEQLLPEVKKYFETERALVLPAAFGLWKYIIYIGRKK